MENREIELLGSSIVIQNMVVHVEIESSTGLDKCLYFCIRFCVRFKELRDLRQFSLLM